MNAFVNVKGTWIPVYKVQFLDIESDVHGYDVMTFKYEGEIFSSRIVNR
jgi:hypothetical protein